jgi:hypothetical protein
VRPEYEREEHRASETEARLLIEKAHGVRLHKSPRYYHIDYFVTPLKTDSVIGWVEIRGKQFARHSFPTFYTSIEKFISVGRMAHTTAKPAYIVAKWSDESGVYKVNWQDARRFNIRLGGRTANSRGDAQDIEPVIHIPTTEFLSINSMDFGVQK